MSLRATAAPEGAGRYDRLHGDEGGIDLAPHMDQALEDVRETVLLFAQYPQPRAGRIGKFRCQFDLYDFIDGKYDRAELVELAVELLTTWGHDHDNLHQRESAKLEKLLTTELQGSEIVRERAEQLAEDEREAA